jgi:uncharacterized protein (TIGR03083 family)
MDKTQLRELVRQERSDLLAFLETLGPDEWNADTLCAKWRVRDVLAHVVCYDSFSLSVTWHAVRAGFSIDKLAMRIFHAWQDRSVEQLLDRLRANLIPGGMTRMIGWPVALQEAVIHTQDIRRPLGRTREIPGERVVGVLECIIDPPALAGVPKRSNELRLEAEDIGWAWGDGEVVSGTGEAIMMALAGRRSVLGELSGPGVPVLASRM